MKGSEAMAKFDKGGGSGEDLFFTVANEFLGSCRALFLALQLFKNHFALYGGYGCSG